MMYHSNYCSNCSSNNYYDSVYSDENSKFVCWNCGEEQLLFPEVYLLINPSPDFETLLWVDTYAEPNF